MIWHTFTPIVEDLLGLIHLFLVEDDPRPAREQIAERYVGGWKPLPGFRLDESMDLLYEGDPPLQAVAWTALRNELIVVYPYSWVVIIQPDETFEVSRCD